MLKEQDGSTFQAREYTFYDLTRRFAAIAFEDFRRDLANYLKNKLKQQWDRSLHMWCTHLFVYLFISKYILTCVYGVGCGIIFFVGQDYWCSVIFFWLCYYLYIFNYLTFDVFWLFLFFCLMSSYFHSFLMYGFFFFLLIYETAVLSSHF